MKSEYDVVGLRAIVHDRVQEGFTGRHLVRYINFIPASDIAPSIIEAAVLMVRLNSGTWILGHILVDDDSRRHGIAERLVLGLERAHGYFGSCWCSESGQAFARAFVERHGERPLWKIGAFSDAELERKLNGLAEFVLHA
jgi:GNAT superfamily N-acetyltransferase